MKTKILFTLFLSIFFISLVSASYISLFPNPNTPNVNIEYTFNFTEYQNCSGVIINHTEIVTTNPRGFGYVQITLPSNTSNLSKIHFLCEWKDSSLRKVHNLSSQFFDKVFISDLYVFNNVNTIGNITASTGFFSWLGSLADRITELFVQDITFNGSINGSGNITTTGNISASYFIGDGSELTGIQHGALTLYLHNETSGVSGSKVLDTAQNDTIEVTLSTLITADDQEIQNFTTPQNVPNLDLLSDGVYEFHFHGRKTAGGTKDVRIYIKMYYVDSSGGNPTLFLTSENSDELTTSSTDYDVHCPVGETDISTSNRLLLQVLTDLSGTGGNPTVEIEIEGLTATRIEIPSPSPTREQFVPYSGAVKNVDLGNYNFTVGLINATDWSNVSITESQISDLQSYILTTSEGNLNVNSSDYWDDLGSINATQMENSGGVLNILVSWLESLFISDTDEGSLNVNSSDYWDNYNTPAGFLWNASFNASVDSRDTDTNVTTECGSNQYLDGDGTCVTADSTGDCGANAVCEGGHTHPASQVTTGTFGAGNYVMDTNLTVEKIVLENDAGHTITDNATCIIIKGDTSTLNIC